MTEGANEKKQHGFFSHVTAVGIASLAFVLAVVAIAIAGTALYKQAQTAHSLCQTLNASRGADAGEKTDDPAALNTRAELREIWTAIGQPSKAAQIPNASLLDCTTGMPITSKENP